MFVKVATKEGHAAIRVESIESIIDVESNFTRITYRTGASSSMGGSGIVSILSTWSTERVLRAIEGDRAESQPMQGGRS